MKYNNLINNINTIRKQKGHLSNAFFAGSFLADSLNNGTLKGIDSEDLVLLIDEKPDLVRVYFYALERNSLQKVRLLLSNYNKPIIIDVVGKDPQARDLANILINCGFEEYSKFVRMVNDKPNMPKYLSNSKVEYANKYDKESIMALLYSEFDPLFAHIPSQSEIEQAINKNEITVVRDDKKIIGLTFFEMISSTNIMFRYFIVDEEFRKKGIGGDLLFYTFNSYPEAKYTLWVGTYNKAMQKYERLNFKHDGLVDYILKLKEN